MSPAKNSHCSSTDKSPPPAPKRSAKTPATPPKLEKKPSGASGNKDKSRTGLAVPLPVAVHPKVKRVRKPKLGQTPLETRKKAREVKRRLAIRKALKVQKKVFESSGGDRKRVRKIHTSIRFRRPRTFRPPRNPKFPRKAIPRRSRLDMFNILEYPLATEAAMRKIEDQNTLVFIVHSKATKTHVRAAVKKYLDVDVVKVNTLICPNGKKKAFIKLSRDFDALDQANKIGII